jgi:hypothetical protein
MSRLGPVLAAPGGALTLLVLGVGGPSYAAGQKPDACGDVGVYCSRVGGQWVVDDTNAGGLDASGGIPGSFAGLFVVGILIAIAITVWKVTTAQKLARQSGMDPGLATQMTLLTDNGLDATYLASSLRERAAADPAADAEPGATRDVTTRLTELKGLLDRGVVTQTEYDARRQAIIDTV